MLEGTKIIRKRQTVMAIAYEGGLGLVHMEDPVFLFSYFRKKKYYFF